MNSSVQTKIEKKIIEKVMLVKLSNFLKNGIITILFYVLKEN